MKKYTKIQRLRRYCMRVFDFLELRSVVYRLHDGTPFVYHPHDDLSAYVYVGRAYEPLESKFLRDYLRPGDVAVDAGANIGFMTKIMSEQIAPSGRVYAIEPSARTFARLMETVTRLKLTNVIPCCFALWRDAAALAFNVSTSGADAQQSLAERDKQGEGVVKWPVCACSLDQMLAIAGVNLGQVSFVKMDVEGVEPAVLDGASALLNQENAPALLVEYNVEAMKACGFTGDDLLSRLSKTHECFHTPLCWPPWWSDETSFKPATEGNIPAECNLVAVPRSGVYSARAKSALRLTA
jgi:FkbM family methyltransferase